MPGSALGQGTKGCLIEKKSPAMVGVCLLVGGGRGGSYWADIKYSKTYIKKSKEKSRIQEVESGGWRGRQLQF